MSSYFNVSDVAVAKVVGPGVGVAVGDAATDGATDATGVGVGAGVEPVPEQAATRIAAAMVAAMILRVAGRTRTRLGRLTAPSDEYDCWVAQLYGSRTRRAIYSMSTGVHNSAERYSASIVRA